jgi:glutamate-1-semialdehyde 2,1-aminomutase
MDKAKKGNKFLDPSSRSSHLYKEAVKVMPGGNSRTSIIFAPHPFYVQSGQGCVLTDVEGVERLDFHNNYTSLIHGHADPDVVKAMNEQLQKGTAYGALTEVEIELAKIITERVASIEQVGFANSGTEGVMLTLRVARAYTGREKIAKFEGAYHGSYDYVEVSVSTSPDGMGPIEEPVSAFDSEGMPSNVLQNVVVLPFNNEAAVTRIIEKNRDTLAAVIADPLPSRAGLMSPKPGFYKFLRQITKQYGILLIADEVMMFRLSYGGGQEMFGMEPDLTAMGKIIGGGLPVGAVCGKAEIMQVFDPAGGHARVPHAGTFNANPITMAAGKATLEKFTKAEVNRLNDLSDTFRAKLTDLFKQLKVRAQVLGAGSMFRIHLTSDPINSYRDSYLNPHKKERMTRLFFELLKEGIYIAPEGIGCLSTPMTMKEVDLFVAAMEASLATLVKEYPDLKL